MCNINNIGNKNRNKKTERVKMKKKAENETKDAENVVETKENAVNNLLVSAMHKYFYKNASANSELKQLLVDAGNNGLKNFSLRCYLVASKNATATSNIKYRVIKLSNTTTGFVDVSLEQLTSMLKQD